MKGTLLNTATVVAGSLVGLGVGSLLPKSLQEFILGLLGLVTVAMGVGMFARSKDFIVVVASLAIGGALGFALGIAPRLDALGEGLKGLVGGGGSFTQGFVAATVLFCVGPITVLGSLEDGLTGSSDLLRLKATLDGIASVFLAGALGVGVLFSALSVLLIQGGIALSARRLAWLREDEGLLGELTGTGGPIILGIGLGLLAIKRLPLADALPALVLAPLLVLLSRRIREARAA